MISDIYKYKKNVLNKMSVERQNQTKRPYNLRSNLVRYIQMSYLDIVIENVFHFLDESMLHNFIRENSSSLA